MLSQTMAHDNSLYQQWGLLAAVLGLFVPMAGGLWWLVNLKFDDTLATGLKIRSELAGLLERAFHNEALKIFELIDDHLPSALSQANAENPRTSAFDRLAQGLQAIDAEQPNRDAYRDVLEHALARIVSKEARKLLCTTGPMSARGSEVGLYPASLRFSFGYETEKLLAYIAKQTTQSKKKQTAYENAARWARQLLVASMIVGSLNVPWLFFDASWAYCLGVISIAALVIMIIGTMTSVLIIFDCYYWIKGRAKWELADWIRDCG